MLHQFVVQLMCTVTTKTILSHHPEKDRFSFCALELCDVHSAASVVHHGCLKVENDLCRLFWLVVFFTGSGRVCQKSQDATHYDWYCQLVE